MKLRMFLIFAAMTALAGAVLAQDGANSVLSTVGSVDLNKYQGRWYEIARYPNKFQKKCVGDTTATYTIKKDGDIEVLNECLKKNGKITRAKGEARVKDSSTNAKLKVRFAPAFLSFLPFVWADYWIIDLADDYSYAVVGDPGRKYLWILSRTPEMDQSTYQGILRRVKEQGFDPNKLIKTPQNQKKD